MKTLRYLILAAALVPAGGTFSTQAQAFPVSFVSETEREFISAGDFDGDGNLDLAITDRDTGRIRIGYGSSQRVFNWTNYINTGVKDASGVTIGRLFSQKKDSAALVSADGNAIAVVEVGLPGQAGTVVSLTPPGLGPNSVVAVDVGGAGNTPLQDLFINTTYNTPTPNQASLFRDNGGKFTKLVTFDMPGAVAHGNRVAFRPGQPEFLCMILTGEEKDTFRADALDSGKPETVALVKDLPGGSDYVVGSFRAGARDLLFFKAGEKTIIFRPVDAEGAALKVGEARSFEFDQQVKSLFVVPADGGDKLVATFGTNEIGGLFSFDGAKAPVQMEALKPNGGELLSGAAVFPNGFVLLSTPAVSKIKYSTRYQQYALAGGTCTAGARGKLPSLADRDEETVPAIHKFILSKLTVTNEPEMKPYTNTIPGSTVKYVMVPIPGGEFTMGSPAGEKDRKADEGPQHKVKIEPFWMGQFEVTWSEFDLFVEREEEYRLRETVPTLPAVNAVSDAVTRPSAPYVDMSFTMGKKGFPAIAMAHHAASKYCQWLSAKSGQFYRLPTEAEWEYACRAGTTTAYFFGDVVSKLGDYAWFEDNSDIKYQKVGKKKPNPWGLYDIYGNVAEWCLDQYAPNFYAQFEGKVATQPWNRATQPYPHVVRGGSWDEPVAACRSAARRGSEPDWNQTDPQLPKSIWWLTDAKWVGFRIIRPLKVPPPEQMLKCWTSSTKKD